MPVTAVPGTDQSYERFGLIVNGPALFNAVVTGLELDIFGYLFRHPDAGAAALQNFTGLPPHKLRVLLHALCSTELVDKTDDGYRNSPAAEELLASDGPDSWRAILLGWKHIYYPAFSHLTSALRAGTNTALSAFPGTEPTLYQRLAHDPESEAILHASMAAFTLRSMSGLLDNPEVATVRHLLDVGGGDGTTATRFAARYPGATVTIFDMPSVSGLAEHNIPPEVVGRVRVHPGDLFADRFPGDVDAILFSHVLEVFSAEQIQILLAKAFDALPAGGRVFVYGFNASDDERRGIYSARLSLYLNVLASGEGMAYPASDYESWMRRAGFAAVTSFADLPYEHGLHVGTKV
jgi:hypothetical protein